MKKLLTLLLALVATVGFTITATAADYPSKPITFIVPYSAGGSSDTLVRGMQPYLEAAMGATLVPKNVTGGGGRWYVPGLVFIKGGRIYRYSSE